MIWFVNQKSQSEKISLWRIWRINLSFFLLLRIDTASDEKKPARGGLNKDKICEEVCIITEYFEKKKKKHHFLNPYNSMLSMNPFS